MVALELSAAGKTLAMRLNEPVELFGKPSERDVFSFLRDLARLLRAGLSMDDALKLLIDMQNKELFVRVLTDMRERIRRGEGLAAAMAEHKDRFSVQVVASVQAGEVSGTLSEALTTVADAMDRALSFKERLRSALIYPAILMTMVTGTFVLVVMFVLPQFAPMFDGNEDKLPFVTRFVMALADFFSNNMGLIALGVCALAFWGFAVMNHQGTKAKVLEKVCGLPGLSMWLVTPDVIRFVRTLGVCSSSGLALDKAIAMATEAVKMPHLGESLLRLRVAVRRGDLLSKSMESLGWIPSLALQFTRVGEQSGNMGKMLEESATILAQDYEAKLEKVLAVLSPVLTLIMGGIVALLVGSVLLGIMSINDVVF
ncbi:type II secretion system F family protein [Kordiimonas sp.]|uniref:type II secretion system F family protein n=1 Tax=Kordiimonas sp. TaxID=1970157 RepID=UPI003A8DA009